MKKTHREAIARKLIMFGAALTLLLGLPFAFANRAFANPTPKFAYVANCRRRHSLGLHYQQFDGGLEAESPVRHSRPGPTILSDGGPLGPVRLRGE